MARMQQAWGNPLKERATKAGVRWVESDRLPLPPRYQELSSLYERIMRGEGCSLASSTAAATENRKV